MYVDTHVIHLPTMKREWWNDCLESTRNEPVELHLLEGVEGHIGRGRHQGFSFGKSPYVSCVDPDDLIVPGAFAACIEALEANPSACGAYTDELLMSPDGSRLKPALWSGRGWNPLLQLEPKYLHHIYVMRRKFVAPLLPELEKWPNLAEFVLKGLITRFGPWVHVNRFGYKWRLHKQSSHRRLSKMDLNAARWRVIPTLRRAAEKYGARLHP